MALEVDGESPLSATALPRSHTSPELPAAEREEEAAHIWRQTQLVRPVWLCRVCTDV